MTPLLLIALGGLLSSSHCIGMCGGFAAIVGLRHSTLARNLRAQLVYSGGRLLSYTTMGAVAGATGQRLATALPRMINVPAILCLVAGFFLMREGFVASGLFRRRVQGLSHTGCLVGPLFTTILRLPGLRNTFSAGIITGMLPCGLVYAFLSLAASSGQWSQGMATMAAFGLGTVPLMVAAGCGAALVPPPIRLRLWKFAAWSVIVTGLLTVGRGVAFLRCSSESQPVICPFCRTVGDKSEPPALSGQKTMSAPPSENIDSL